MRRKHVNIDLTKSDTDFFNNSDNIKTTSRIPRHPIKQNHYIPENVTRSQTIPEKKYGIKTLLETKNKIKYPFTHTDYSTITNDTINSIENSKHGSNNINQSKGNDIIKSEILININPSKENDIIINNIETNFLCDLNDIKKGHLIVDNMDNNKVNEQENLDNVIPILDEIIIDNGGDGVENNTKPQEEIVETKPPLVIPKLKPVMNEPNISSDVLPPRASPSGLPLGLPLETSPHVLPEIKKNTDKFIIETDNVQSLNDTQAQLLISRRKLDIEAVDTIPLINVFTPLNIDDISVSLKVIGDLAPGRKLKIVNNTHLADDTSYVASVTRYNSGQGRNKIFAFLEHLYVELVRNVNTILVNIRANINIDHNVSMLRGIICKLAVFLHKYENMRSVYQLDSSMYARLGNNRDKFHVFLDNFFRDVTISK